MGSQCFHGTAAIGHVAGGAGGLPLDQADPPGKGGRRAGRRDRRKCRGPQCSREQTAAKPHGGRALDRVGDPFGLHIERDKLPVEARRRDHPLKEILGRSARRRAAQQGDDFLKGWARHAGLVRG